MATKSGPKRGLRRLMAALSGVSFLTMAACGGSGGGGEIISTPAPSPAPSPTPSPSPTPTATNFNTPEYRQSDGPAQHGAITVWQAGNTGKGVSIAVIDSGIDVDSPEFAGRIAPASADVAGNRSIESEDGHGTQVALVAAAARNGEGIMGIAFDSTILALRADEPGTCAAFDPADSSSGCSFLDSDIARGIDAAVTAGVRVVNLSMGGSYPAQGLLSAVERAAAAGLVIVVSAGNDGDSTDPLVDPANPDPFAVGLSVAARENVIIVGSVDASNTISGFSNRAGSEAQYYVTARGENVCCVYENGEIYVEVDGGTEYIYVLNGTSFSAPQVSGAAALLAQAFPNLSGAEIVDLILAGARDVGAIGIDAIYGQGVLDIAASFAPQGQTSLAGTTTAIALGQGMGVTSPAMGDAARRARLGAVVLDSYDRAYGVDLAAGLGTASVTPQLYGAVTGRTQGLSAHSGARSLVFAVDPGTVHAADPLRLWPDAATAQRPLLLSARFGTRISPQADFAFAYREGARGLETSLSGRDRPAFLLASEGTGDLGFVARRAGAMAVRQRFGGLGLTGSIESGDVWSEAIGDDPLARGEANSFTRYSGALDWDAKRLSGRLGTSWLSEARTVLGARFSESIGSEGADSLFLDAMVSWRPVPGWSFSGDYRRGLTAPRSGGFIAGGSRLASSAWSIDAEREGVLGGTLALRLSQPLRVERGGLDLNLPVGWDYASEKAAFGKQRLSLSPGGREISSEVRWQGSLAGGDLTTSLFWRREPGHMATMSNDTGAAIRWSAAF